MADCNHRTAEVGDAAGAVLLKYHLDTAHPAAAATAKAEKVVRPEVDKGCSTEDWDYFVKASSCRQGGDCATDGLLLARPQKGPAQRIERD